MPARKPPALNLARVLYALGDPLRLLMVAKMAAHKEVSCGDMCPVTPRSTLTHHLTILREAGVIQTRKEGQIHWNALNEAALEKAFPGLLDCVLKGVPPLPASHGGGPACS